MSKFGQRLIQSAREARAIARGEMSPKDYRAHVPADIDARAIRESLHLSQAEFASRFGLNTTTIREWEQGRRKPEGPARVLLIVIKNEPKAVQKALEHELA
jgi:putative transcriptional regulator